jgi:quinol monooxygenase YgiN
MSHTVSAVFTFKNSSSKDMFIDFCNGDNGLSVTRAWDGCKSIDCFEPHTNPLQVTIWQKWASPQAHESYVKHRHEDGSFDFLDELISCPPEINPLRPVLFKTDEQQIHDIVNDMCNKDHRVGNKHMHEKTLFIQHMHEKTLFIRPTGNPITLKGWNDMMSSDDVTVEESDLVNINQLRISGNMAYVCYTTHDKYSDLNDDIVVFTSILEKGSGRWKVVFGQRSTGRKPSYDAPPIFPSA